MSNNQNRPRANSFIQPVVNPFVHELGFSFFQKVQIVVMSLTIAPLRLLAFIIMLTFTWLFSKIATYGMTVEMKDPASSSRLKLFNIVRKMGRLCVFFLGFHHIEVKGKRALVREAPLVVIAPHSSLFDVFVLFVSDPLPSGVSRMENYLTPIIGNLSLAMQPVFVSRNDPDSRKKTIQEIVRRAQTGGKWPQITVFPEGTCTNRKALITFKAGAFIPGVAVQPAAVEYFNDLDTFTWTMKGPGTLSVLWLSLCQFSIKTRITYLPVYNPSKEEKDDPKLYANNVRTLMANALNLPCTDHTFEDCRLMRKAESLNLPMESGLVEFAKLSRKLGININSVQDKLEEFSSIACKDSDGLVSVDDFARFLNVPISPALRDLFKLYDRNDSGFIDFREYVIGLSLVSQPAATRETVKLAFKVFDKDQNGMITQDEFEQVLNATFGDEINGSEIFDEIEKSSPSKVTFEEFYKFVNSRPEYAKLFVWYKEMMEDSIDDFKKENNLNYSRNNHETNDSIMTKKQN